MADGVVAEVGGDEAQPQPAWARVRVGVRARARVRVGVRTRVRVRVSVRVRVRVRVGARVSPPATASAPRGRRGSDGDGAATALAPRVAPRPVLTPRHRNGGARGEAATW
jgi:hypothetical protein